MTVGELINHAETALSQLTTADAGIAADGGNADYVDTTDQDAGKRRRRYRKRTQKKSKKHHKKSYKKRGKSRRRH